ncbi:MAG: hypothetical protein HOP33_08940 [Verrucomicrobia bacterium]|nr:hypothetical protein [Verrucomicrobiota bacterium]
MKKPLIAIALLLCLCIRGAAQFYASYTNLSTTNWFATSATHTYTNLNFLDCSHNTQLGLSFIGYGSGASSNTTLTFTYLQSRDSTNWFLAPFALVWYAQGTNGAAFGTNVDTGAFPYVKAYQVTSTATNDITNSISAPLMATVKGYRRDE